MLTACSAAIEQASGMFYSIIAEKVVYISSISDWQIVTNDQQ